MRNSNNFCCCYFSQEVMVKFTKRVMEHLVILIEISMRLIECNPGCIWHLDNLSGSHCWSQVDAFGSTKNIYTLHCAIEIGLKCPLALLVNFTITLGEKYGQKRSLSVLLTRLLKEAVTQNPT